MPEASTDDVDRAVQAARRAFDAGPWPRMAPSERADYMEKISALIQARHEEVAKTITEEMGSPISFSVMGQVFASTMVLDYYTALAREYAFEEFRQGALGPVVVRREPVGVVGAIVPWNVPLFTIMLKLGPALASGSTVVLKPAPETPLDAYLLADVLEEVGLPAGVVNIVQAGREVGEHLVTHADVDKIGFTGSTAAGKKIGSAVRGAAQALHARARRQVGRHLPRRRRPRHRHPGTAPELDHEQRPGVHRADAHPRVARSATTRSSTRWRRRWRRRRSASRSTPRRRSARSWPSASATACMGYIEKGREEGARVVTGGGRPAGFAKGWFVEPTVFADVDNKMTIAQEEIFGPVLAVIPYDSEEDAVRIANESDYGLAGSVWTSDPNAGLEIAKQVRTGTYGVNGSSMNFAAPFGGFKQSGIGRELGPEGLEAYLEPKGINMPFGWEPTA